jgi:hypothetical protein
VGLVKVLAGLRMRCIKGSKQRFLKKARKNFYSFLHGSMHRPPESKKVLRSFFKSDRLLSLPFKPGIMSLKQGMAR